MNILAGFADISLGQLVLVGGMALLASIVGGLAGYGTGALMPLVLVPLIGAEPVVPIIAISAIFTNISRFVAYFRYADRRRALIVIGAAALTTALGAYGYTRLTGTGAALVIGSMLILSVPLRRLARKREIRIGDTGLGVSAVGYGVLVGGTSGSGVILLSLLMASGLEGAAVIATDAVISVATGLIKISVFGLAGVVTAQVLAFALLIGAIAIPGAFLAKAFVERMPVHIHTAILDAAVMVGGVVMITAALRHDGSMHERRRADREAVQARNVADERHAAQKADRTIFHPDLLHLMQRQAAERADPPGQIIQLGVDLFLACDDFPFLRGVPVAPGGPLPRGRQPVVRGLEAVVHRQDVVLGAVPVDALGVLVVGSRRRSG